MHSLSTIARRRQEMIEAQELSDRLYAEQQAAITRCLIADIDGFSSLPIDDTEDDQDMIDATTEEVDLDDDGEPIEDDDDLPPAPPGDWINSTGN